MTRVHSSAAPGKGVGPDSVHISPQSVTAEDRQAAIIVWRLIDGAEVPDRHLDGLPQHWLDVALAARDSRPPEGDGTSSRVWKARAVQAAIHWVRSHNGEDGWRLAEGMTAAWAATEKESEQAEIEPKKPAFDFGIIDSATFDSREYPREWGVDNVFVMGQPCVVGAPKKTMKTSTMIDLAVSIGAAVPFLGNFVVPKPRKVLFLSRESGEATIQETARRVCEAKRVSLHWVNSQVLWGFKVPQLSSPEQVAALADVIRENGVEVVIIDPLYLCLISGSPRRIDPANLFDIGPLLAQVAEACLEAGATPILVHHLRKNREDPKSPPELEDLAFAGIQEFARQWFLIGRREAYEPGTGEHKLWLSVGGSAGHSGCWALDISEGIIGDHFGGRRWDVTVNRAAEARARDKEAAEAAKVERKMAQDRLADEARARRLRDDAAAFHRTLRKQGRATARNVKMAGDFGWNNDRLKEVVGYLESHGMIRPAKVLAPCGKGQRELDGYEAVADLNIDSHRDTATPRQTTAGEGRDTEPAVVAVWPPAEPTTQDSCPDSPNTQDGHTATPRQQHRDTATVAVCRSAGSATAPLRDNAPPPIGGACRSVAERSGPASDSETRRQEDQEEVGCRGAAPAPEEGGRP